MKKLSSTLFTVVKESRKFVTEASTLKGKDGGICSDGFIMVSEATGKEASWAYVTENKDAEHEVSGWTFVPTDETLKTHPQLRGWAVEIFND